MPKTSHQKPRNRKRLAAKALAGNLKLEQLRQERVLANQPTDGSRDSGEVWNGTTGGKVKSDNAAWKPAIARNPDIIPACVTALERRERVSEIHAVIMTAPVAKGRPASSSGAASRQLHATKRRATPRR